MRKFFTPANNNKLEVVAAIRGNQTPNCVSESFVSIWYRLTLLRPRDLEVRSFSIISQNDVLLQQDRNDCRNLEDPPDVKLKTF